MPETAPAIEVSASENPLRPVPASESPAQRNVVRPKIAKEESKRGAESGEEFIRDTPDQAEETAADNDRATLFREETECKQEIPFAQEEAGYSIVKVYYATDRAARDVGEWWQAKRQGWPVLVGVCAVLTAALMFWRPERGRMMVRGFAWTMLMLTALLGSLTIIYQMQPQETDRPIERMYGSDRGELEVGVCEVSVPQSHEVGALEGPSIIDLDFYETPERHVVLLGVHPRPSSQFYDDLRQCVEKSSRKEAFVFIHGYNVGFETAVRRTAQIAYDLKFEGAPIVYSWPSQEGLLSYTIDETNVVWTVPHLKEFLVGVAERSGATCIHLVAHSMGNRALTSAVSELARERREQCPRFHEIILTAPDIDADVFRRDIAPAIVGAADRVTLYASSNDEALMASRAVHGYRRAGESGDHLVVVPGVDTVDVSEIDTSLIGHSYYGSNTTVLADLFELIQGSKPPEQRQWLRAMRMGALKYWKFLGGRPPASNPAGEEL